MGGEAVDGRCGLCHLRCSGKTIFGGGEGRGKIKAQKKKKSIQQWANLREQGRCVDHDTESQSALLYLP